MTRQHFLLHFSGFTCTPASPAGQTGSLSSGLYEGACSPEANVLAVWYRASILGVLQLLPENPLTPWSHGGKLDDAVFQIAATFPMKKLPIGLVKNGLPLDVQELVKQIRARTSDSAKEGWWGRWGSKLSSRRI
jgi:hypothetical protein